MDVEIDPGFVESRLEEFARYGAHGETGVWRTLYSPEWVAAADRYAEWCREAGLDVRRDAVGNVWGQVEGREDGKSIVSGSHIDTVTPGGKFDGALGAIGAMIAVRALLQRYGKPRRTLEAVALCEEESSRFRANFWGSRAVTGRIGSTDPDTIIGFDGVSLADAMRAAGLDPLRCGEARRDDIGAFIELHIEQGPVLESAGVPVAIVSGITAIRGVVVELTGTANHAGAFPMLGRRDPLAGFAEIVAGVTECAERMGPPAVTTIGRVEVEPNLATAIAGSVRFTIDARHANTGQCAELCAAQDAFMREVVERRGLNIDWQVTSKHDACRADPKLLDALNRATRDLAIPSIEMVSGAAHDAQQMARIAPVAMVFVRSKGGRSHTPEEFSATEDMVAGIRLLAGALHELAY